METKKIFFVFLEDNRNLGNSATLKTGQKGFPWNVSQTDSKLQHEKSFKKKQMASFLNGEHWLIYLFWVKYINNR